MKSRLLTYILVALPLMAMAQTQGEHIHVVLNSGTEQAGTVRFANEQVVVLVNDRGQAFQHLRTDIQSWAPDSVQAAEVKTEKGSPITVEVALMAGYANVKAAHYNSNKAYGNVADLDADVFVGYNNLLQKHIFIGGGLGYHLLTVGQGHWMFLPLMARAVMPFMLDKKVHPYVALNAGYAFAIGGRDRKKEDGLKGGAIGELDLGALLPIRGGKHIGVALFGRVMGYGSSNTIVTKDGVDYNGDCHRTQLSGGVRISVHI